MIKIGITGNIASGKSEFEKILESLNFEVYDLDILSKEIFEEKKDEIEIIFNTLNKKTIADIIFSNKEKKEALENIIHPKLKQKIFEIFKKDSDIVFISGAILYQSGFDKFFDKIIFVDAPPEIRLKRLIKRNNLSYDEALLRLNSQNDYGKDKADFIVQNSSDIKNLKQNAIKIINLLSNG